MRYTIGAAVPVLVLVLPALSCLAADGAGERGAKVVERSVLLDDCESVALWPGLEVSRELRTQGRASLRWDYTKGADWSIRRRRMPGPIDLTGYNAIEFDMYFDTDVVFGVFILIFDLEGGGYIDPGVTIEASQHKWIHTVTGIPPGCKVKGMKLAVPDYRIKGGSGRVVMYLDNVKASRRDDMQPKIDSVARMLAVNRDYYLWSEGSTTKVMRDRDVADLVRAGRPRGRISISAAANEYEPFQLVLRPRTGKAIRDISLSFTDLKGKGDEYIAKENIKYNPIHYVNVPKSQKTDWSAFYGPIPDILRNVKFFDATSQESYPVWVTVKVPGGTAPGAYKGKITVASANSRPSTVELRVRVWDFSLPPNNQTHVLTELNVYASPGFSSAELLEYDRRDLETVRRDYYRNCGEHRIGTALHAFWPDMAESGPRLRPRHVAEVKRWYEYAVEECGMPSGMLPIARGSTDRRGLAEVSRYFREKGWLDRFFYWVIDEPSPADYGRIKRICDVVRSVDPDIKRLVTKEIIPELHGTTNCWCPLVRHFDAERAAERVKMGEKVWWYEVSSQFPVVGTKTDHRAVEPRVIFWMMWKYDIEGFLIWHARSWCDPGNRKPTDPWACLGPCRPGPGLGILLYPDRDNGWKGICNTIRWELLREGIEDYEYHWLLRDGIANLKRTGHAALARESANILEDCDSFITDPLNCARIGAKDLYQARERIARQLEKIARALAESEGNGHHPLR